LDGIDFNETFAPVVAYTTIRLLLTLATIYDWEVHQMNFVKIYMIQPPGYYDNTKMVLNWLKACMD
jgi:hypothetical protein